MLVAYSDVSARSGRADGADIFAIWLRIADRSTSEYCGARHKHIRAGLCHARRRVHVDTAIYFNVHGAIPDHGAQGSDLVGHIDEFLAAKAGVRL